MILFLFRPPISALTTPISRSIYVPVSPNLQFLKQDTLSLASKLCQMLFLLLGTLPTPTFSPIVLAPSSPGSDISSPRKIFPGAPSPPLVWGRHRSDESQPLSEPLHPGFIASLHSDLYYKIICLSHWTEVPPVSDCACLGHCLALGTSTTSGTQTVCSTHFCQAALSLQRNSDHIIGRLDFFGGSDGKESAGNAGDQGLISGSGRSPGEGNGSWTKSLVGYSPWGRKESDMTEWRNTFIDKFGIQKEGWRDYNPTTQKQALFSLNVFVPCVCFSLAVFPSWTFWQDPSDTGILFREHFAEPCQNMRLLSAKVKTCFYNQVMCARDYRHPRFFLIMNLPLITGDFVSH